jgi:hypothetical protein
MNNDPNGFQKLARRLVLALGFLGLAGFIWTMAMWNQQLDTLPRSPYPAKGGIYPRNIHGVIVYQTNSERDHLEMVQYASIGVFGLSIFLSVLYKKKWGPDPNPKPPKIGTGWQPK